MPIHINSSYKIFTLYGPLAIHSYGLFIALGIIISMYLMSRNKRFNSLNLDEKFTTIILVSIIAGVIGGRLVEILSEPALYPHWYDWFALWNGGFSALGSILGVTIIMPLYLKKINVPVIPLFDFAAIYAPLFQSIARIGCLTAGCCHGIATQSIFAVIYTHPNTIAQCQYAVHPTQFYSSMILFCIFLFMFFVAQYHLKKPGQLFTTYLILASTERFMIDFLRADRIIVHNLWLSLHQLIALAIFCLSLIFFIWLSLLPNKKHSNPLINWIFLPKNQKNLD